MESLSREAWSDRRFSAALTLFAKQTERDVSGRWGAGLHNQLPDGRPKHRTHPASSRRSS